MATRWWIAATLAGAAALPPSVVAEPPSDTSGFRPGRNLPGPVDDT